MARRKKYRRTTTKARDRRQRAIPQIRQADRLLPLPAGFLAFGPRNNVKQTKPKKRQRRLLHDRRLWTPESLPHERYGRQDKRRRFVLRDRKADGRNRQTKAREGIADFKRDEVCIRRSRRRESLFARGRAGKGIRVTTPKRLNDLSKVRCK